MMMRCCWFRSWCRLVSAWHWVVRLIVLIEVWPPKAGILPPDEPRNTGAVQWPAGSIHASSELPWYTINDQDPIPCKVKLKEVYHVSWRLEVGKSWHKNGIKCKYGLLTPQKTMKNIVYNELKLLNFFPNHQNPRTPTYLILVNIMYVYCILVLFRIAVL